MLVIHVATELAPIAKVGGLGDVVYGLSKELIRQGHSVRVVLPKYRSISLDKLQNPRVISRKTFARPDQNSFEVLFWEASYESLSLILVDPQSPEAIFNRDSIYGENDDIHRFLLFCALTLDYLSQTPLPPFVLHLHDWPTATLCLLHKKQENRLKLKTVLTLHNMLHQGRCSPGELSSIGLEPSLEMQDPCQSNLINLLKIGITHSDCLTTVSPTYAEEIQTPWFGYHLDSLLRECRHKLHGILNGIDFEYWNPYQDRVLPFTYPKDSISKTLEAKYKNKEHLYKELRIPPSKTPLFACITRLDEQKGPHLIAHGVKTILDQGGQCVILGKIVSSTAQDLFDALRKTYAHHPHFHFHDRFDESLAKLLYAAADFIMIPSLFEPCGLTQMIAMRYYTIPIVRSTGGLADTVHDIENTHIKEDQKVGICFKDMNPEEFDHALRKAFRLYHDKTLLHHVLKNLSLQDFSWTASTKKYLELYTKLI